MNTKARIIRLEQRREIRVENDLRHWTDQELEDSIRKLAGFVAPPGYVQPDLDTDEGMRQLLADVDRFDGEAACR